MDEASNRRQSRASPPLPIQGMESVVVTVSGYHGLERLKLIKLIDQAGGSYVGALNQSTTHLICRKFEGIKYEIARKLKTVIVNHRWIEDCIKQGRRVSEHSYTLRCGKEMGPLLMDIPGVSNKVSELFPDQSNADNNSKKHVIDIESEDNNHAVWTDSSLLMEEMFPELEKDKKSYRSERKVVKKRLRQDHSSTARYDFDKPPLSCDTNMEPKMLDSPSSTRCLRQKRSTSSVEPSPRGHKLVPKNMTRDSLEALSEEEWDPVHRWHDDIIAPSNNSSGRRNRRAPRIREASNDDLEEAEDIKDSSVAFENPSSTEGASASPVDQSAIHKDCNEIELATRLSKSAEVSCVICWTEFSSTRGVLPCGHRFCFSCIQNWADRVSSSGKVSTCPLCKATFVSITKMDDAVSSDQKIYSQTIPHDPSSVNIYILPHGETPVLRTPASLAPVCIRCSSRAPEDCLIRCHLCMTRCVHSYCLDPYILPWTCSHCKDLRMLYHHFH